MISAEVKEFIEENIDLIEDNKWEEVYESIYPQLGLYHIGEFTQIILEANINPLEYMDYIPYGYLYNSSDLENFTIPDHIKTIGDWAFRGCSGLMGIDIPNSVESIGDYAFQFCEGLTNIIIPDGVANIGWMAFCGCQELTNMVIGNGVTEIGSALFQDCIALKSVTIPSSVVRISTNAFRGCRKLKNIHYLGTKEQWQKIDKRSRWIPRYSNKYIHCTDGDIELK